MTPFLLVGLTEVLVAGARGAPALALLGVGAGWALVGFVAARIRWTASPWAAAVLYLLGSALLVVEARGVGLVLAALGACVVAFTLLRLLGSHARPLATLAAVPAVLAGLSLRGVPLALPARLASVPPAHGPTVILLTVDTLRADVPLPTFAALAARGRTGPCWSTAPWTLPALASIQTGVTPYAHGAIVRAPVGGHTRVGTIGAPTLAERFHAAGWRTAAFVDNPHASVAAGFARGFDVWDPVDDRDPPRSLLLDPLDLGLDGRSVRHPMHAAAAQVSRAITWLSTADRPAFLWLHLLGPHLPYLHADLSPGTALGDALGAGGQGRLNLDLLRRGGLRWTPALRAAMRAAYVNEATFADAALAAIVQAAGPDAIVLYTADHGESQGEHGDWEHGHALWEEVVRVPLAVAGPGVTPGAFAAPASLVDVAPTLLALAGLPTDGLPGADLRALPPARDLFLEDTLYFEEREGVVRWPWKLTRTFAGDARLVDLSADPGEAVDVTRPDVARALSTALDAEHARLGDTPLGSESAAIRALGYSE